MKRLFLSLLCATLCLTWQGATAQESQYTTLPKFVDTSGTESYTSELLTFEQPISGIRITYHKTTGGGTYNNYPYVYFGEIYITDTNGNDVSYTATTNSLASGDGDGLAALNDKNESTYYHSAYSSSHPIQPDGP
ncbi:MAG: hypothetical protein IIV57_04980, partial [Bacteroidaceae bacterium]|nr:hypothetical protein [Bacteroidaceae bacterium]